MNDLLANLFPPLAASWGYWIIARGLTAARAALKWTARKSWPLALLLALAMPQARAGWFTRGPDPKTEAANRALERAAQIAAESASTQAREHGRLLQAVEALSNERTHLAKHLEHLGSLASRDSAYAAAIQAAAPLLVAVAVLALGCAAIWLVTRSGSQDAELASVLVDEITGTGIGLVGPCGQGLPKTHPGPAHLTGANRGIDIYSGSKDASSLPSPSLAEEPARQSLKSQEGELPF